MNKYALTLPNKQGWGNHVVVFETGTEQAEALERDGYMINPVVGEFNLEGEK